MNICKATDCENVTEGRTDFCASHNKLRRDAVKRAKKDAEKLAVKLSTPQQPRAKVKKVSDKRKVINEEYFKLVEQFKIDNPYCEAKINNFCTQNTEDPHHSRGRRGAYLMDTSTWIPVCRSCHRYIEDHPLDSQKRGLSFSRLEIKTTI